MHPRRWIVQLILDGSIRLNFPSQISVLAMLNHTLAPGLRWLGMLLECYKEDFTCGKRLERCRAVCECWLGSDYHETSCAVSILRRGSLDYLLAIYWWYSKAEVVLSYINRAIVRCSGHISWALELSSSRQTCWFQMVQNDTMHRQLFILWSAMHVDIILRPHFCKLRPPEKTQITAEISASNVQQNLDLPCWNWRWKQFQGSVKIVLESGVASCAIGHNVYIHSDLRLHTWALRSVLTFVLTWLCYQEVWDA